MGRIFQDIAHSNARKLLPCKCAFNRTNWLRGIATSFIYGESLDGRGFAMVSYYDRTTSILDSTRGVLHVPTDTRTFMSPWKILHGIIDEIWRSEVTTIGHVITK